MSAYYGKVEIEYERNESNQFNENLWRKNFI